jgi:hypothetical protein
MCLSSPPFSLDLPKHIAASVLIPQWDDWLQFFLRLIQLDSTVRLSWPQAA